MIGTIVSHYKILEKLGGGGMGVVYKAEDTKLKRLVALKFLPAELTSDPAARERFVHEAQAASALDHSNICTIYEIGETEDGQSFIALAYYQGETLKKKIERGPLKLEEATDIASQIAQGLARAHEAGIVHRDIKPANVMMTDRNEVKIVDFGLAKLTGRTQLTKTGSTVGTVAYMSPELARGEKADHRTDIWSLGVVLYEMLTGRTPFRGEHDAAMMYSILNEQPEPADKHRPELSAEWLHALNRALEKDPDDRYQTVHDMVIDLRRLKKESSRVSRAPLAEVRPPEPQKPVEAPPKVEPVAIPSKTKVKTVILPAIIAAVLLLGVATYFLFFREEAEIGARVSIAVADFINETGEKELDGLSGMLITSLEQSPRLAVLTRSRMFDILKQLGKTDADRIDEGLGREICKHANVGALAISSIRKFGRLYTIDLKIIDPQEDEHLFTAREEGEGQESVPSMIDRLSEKTRVGLKEKPPEIRATSQKVAETTTTNLEAYQHYFKGEQLISQLKFNEAKKELQKAIALDSTFALAHYRFAYALAWSVEERAKEQIRKAMQFIDKLPEKERYLIRAENSLIQGNVDESISIYQELLKRYPDEKEALYEIGDYSYHKRDFASAETYLEKVLVIDPTFERAYQHLIWTYWDTEQYDKALDYARQYVSKAPSDLAYEMLGDAYNFQGDFDQAFQTYGRALELFPNSTTPIEGIGRTYIFKNNFERAETEFRKLLDDRRPLVQKRTGYQNLALLYGHLGRYSETLRMIDKNIEINSKLADSTGLAHSYALKAYFLVAGRNEPEKARKTIEKGLEFLSAGDIYFYLSLFDTYVALGEHEKAASIAKDHLAVISANIHVTLNAHIYHARRAFTDAIREFDTVLRRGGRYEKFTSWYRLGELYFQTGEIDKAVTALRNIQTLFVYYPNRAIYFPKSVYLLGKVNEERGNRDLAIESYEKFLSIWKNADRDLPELTDAKARLAKLKATAE